MASIQVNPSSSRLRALKFAVEMNIDMLNDMALDSMWFTPQALRELATKSDEQIRDEINKNSKEAYENIDKLIALEFLYVELKEIE